ncbi:transferase [Hypoxylon sp. FL1284]|nr:transferase [Hypoxylon sp. FL1284]
MPRQEVYHLHPAGWENDPEEERFKCSTLDYLGPSTYSNYALFFKLDDVDKSKIVVALKEALVRTLSQARHLCGTIEKDVGGGHSFVKKRDSTVQFHVQWLDSPDDKYPSFDDISKNHFSATIMGDPGLWSVYPMTFGEKPEAHPDNSPVISAFKANFVRGGLVLNMMHHHYANDVMGWAAFTHQLAENCKAILNGGEFPSWDPRCLDRSRITKDEGPEESRVDFQALEAHQHASDTAGVSLLFHLPKSKAAEIKKLAAPTDGTWVSTYDAFSAFIWRTLSRLRAPAYRPDPASHLFWCEVINMRPRLRDPGCPARSQGYMAYIAATATAPVPQPTAAEVVAEWPLWRLASYVRQITNSVTPEFVDAALEAVAPVRDKTVITGRLSSHPPLSLLTTDHRDANITAADFGFGRPETYRHFWGDISIGIMTTYPPRLAPPGSDEGCEFTIMYEKAFAQALIDDPEWSRYFEYRGIDDE